MSNALARRATALPISPKPIMPIVFPDTSLPLKNKGAHPSNPVIRDNWSPSTIRRATASTNPIVKSAVAFVDALGVFVTSILFLEHTRYQYY